MKNTLFQNKMAKAFGLTVSLVSAGICAAVALASPQVVFSDSNFSPTHYTVVSRNFGNGGIGNITFGSGNVSIQSTVTPGNYSYSYHNDFLMCKWAKYDPTSQGAIKNISWKQTVNYNKGQGDAGPMLIIFQGGKYFRSLRSVILGSNNLSISKINLISNDFDEVVTGIPNPSAPGGINANSHPDFTSSGSIMQFGIAGGKSAGPGAPGSSASAVLIVDDWEIKVVPM